MMGRQLNTVTWMLLTLVLMGTALVSCRKVGAISAVGGGALAIGLASIAGNWEGEWRDQSGGSKVSVVIKEDGSFKVEGEGHRKLDGVIRAINGKPAKWESEKSSGTITFREEKGERVMYLEEGEGKFSMKLKLVKPARI